MRRRWPRSITDAMRLGMDPGAADVLDHYERARRASTSPPMGVMTDGLNRLFSNDVLPVRLIRDLGLGLVDRHARPEALLHPRGGGFAKREAPRLLRGEAL